MSHHLLYAGRVDGRPFFHRLERHTSLSNADTEAFRGLFHERRMIAKKKEVILEGYKSETLFWSSVALASATNCCEMASGRF